MSLLAVVFIACLVAFFTGVAVSPGNTFRGLPAAVSFLGMCSTGLVLSIHALS